MKIGKIIVISLIFLFNIMNAEEITLSQNKWKLVGVKSSISDMSIFDKSCIESLWSYDSITSNWTNYSLNNYNSRYDKINTLSEKEGFWIVANSDNCTVSLPDNLHTIAEVDFKDINSSWQLLGSNYDISDMSIFDENCIDLVWKYSDLEQWELFDPASRYMYDSKFTSISSGEGFWVKGKVDKKCDIEFITNERLQALSFLDQSDLSNQESLTDDTNKKQYKNYRFDIWSRDLTIYDISNPSDLVQIASLSLNSSLAVNSDFWDINDNYLVIPYTSSGFEVIDIRDISNPVSLIYSNDEYEQLSNYKGQNYYGHADSVYINDNRVILSVELIGKSILDITNPQNMVNTKNEYYFEGTSLAQGKMIRYGKNILNIATSQIQILDPDTLSIVYSLPATISSLIERAFVVDNILYVINDVNQVYRYILQ